MSYLSRATLISRLLCAPLAFAAALPSLAAETRGTINASTLSCEGAPRADCGGGYVAEATPSTGSSAVRLLGCHLDLDQEFALSQARAVAAPTAEVRFAVFSRPDRPKEGAPPLCRRLSFQMPPSWISSATWGHDKNELIVVDAVTKRTLHYRLSNPTIQYVSVDTQIVHPPRNVLKIRDSEHGYLVEVAGPDNSAHEIISVRPDFVHRVAALRLGTEEHPRRSEVRAVYQWIEDSNALIAFADIRSSDGKWRTGVVRIAWTETAEPEFLFETKVADPMVSYYYLGLDYLARAAGDPYLLVMKDKPYILRLAPKSEPLDLLPSRFRNAPPLPALSSPSSFPEAFRTMAASTMPVGMYGSGEHLYVLGRSPGGEGTNWFLTRITPRQRAVDWTVRLPTTAEHLAVVPGESYWAFIEKGEVRELGSQSVLGVFLVPAATLEEPMLRGDLQCQG